MHFGNEHWWEIWLLTLDEYVIGHEERLAEGIRLHGVFYRRIIEDWEWTVEAPGGRAGCGVDSDLRGACKRRKSALVRRELFLIYLFWAFEMSAESNCCWGLDGDVWRALLSCNPEVGHRATSRNSTRWKCAW